MNNEKKYFYAGIDKTGKRISGELLAENLSMAKLKLQHDGVLPVRIIERKELKIFRKNEKIPKKYIVEFCSQLAVLINASISLVIALDIIKNSSLSITLQKLIATIKQEVEKGSALSSILLKYPNYFDILFCNLVSVGEQSGTLDQILKYLAFYYEKTLQEQRKIKKILLYPLIIFIVAVLIAGILLAFVVPEFQAMFASFNAKLPLYTQCIVQLAILVRKFGLIILLFFSAVLFFAFWANKNLNWFKEYLDNVKLKLPCFGEVIRKSIIARIARILGITFRAGLPLHDALNMVHSIVENSRYKYGILQIREKIMNGQTLNYAIDSTNLFPKRFIQLVMIGEESGTLDDILFKLASYYEDEVNYFTDNLQSLLEPVIMVVLGVLVGGLVIGMYLPIFQLGKII